MDDLILLGVPSLALFGSLACDEARAGSGIDLLVELAPSLTCQRDIRVKCNLEDRLVHPVDGVMPDTIKPRARPQVMKAVIPVA